MAIFGGKKEESFPGMIGVDLGTAGIKLIELIPDRGRLKLSTYGYAEPKTPSMPAKVPIDDIQGTVQILNKLRKEGNFKATRAVAALPTTNVFHAIISLPVPKNAKDDLKPLIEAQAEKLLPLPLSEMVLDSNILDKHLLPKEGAEDIAAQNEGKFLRVLLTGAPKTLIAKYIELFKQASLELVSLETEMFALTRALVGKEKAHVLIVDLGAERTNLAIVKEGVPLLTRVIKSGGSTVTQAFASGMGMSFSEAEAMKRDLAFAGGAMPAPLLEALKPIIHEIKYALDLYGEQANGEKVEKILLTGGGARLPGLSEVLTQTLNMNVYLGDPWARLSAAPDVRGVLEEIGPRYSVAIGLAERLEEKL